MKVFFPSQDACPSSFSGPCVTPASLVFHRFIPEPWSACSTTCGPGVQVREVKCRVLLTFTQAETELPEEECDGPKLPTTRPCLLQACDSSPASLELEDGYLHEKDSEMTYDWEYAGFTPCTATCLGGRCWILSLRDTYVCAQVLGGRRVHGTFQE